MQIAGFSLFRAQTPAATTPTLASDGLQKYDKGREIAYNWILEEIQNDTQNLERKLAEFFNHGRLGVVQAGPKPAEFQSFLLDGIRDKKFSKDQADVIKACLNGLAQNTFAKGYRQQHDRCPPVYLTNEQETFLGIEESDAGSNKDSSSITNVNIDQIIANRGGSGAQSEGSDSVSSSEQFEENSKKNGVNGKNPQENRQLTLNPETLGELGERRIIDDFSRSPSLSQVSNQLEENQVIEQLEKEAEEPSEPASEPSEAGFFHYMYGSKDPEQRTSFQKMNRFLAFDHGFDSTLGQVIAIISALVLDILCVATAGILYGVMALACHSHDRGMQAAEELDPEQRTNPLTVDQENETAHQLEEVIEENASSNPSDQL